MKSPKQSCLVSLAVLALVSSNVWALTTPSCTGTKTPKNITYFLIPTNGNAVSTGVLGTSNNYDPMVLTDHLHVHIHPKKKNIGNLSLDLSAVPHECNSVYNGSAWVLDSRFSGTGVVVSVLGGVLIDPTQTVAARIPIAGIGFANGGSLANLPNMGHRFKNIAPIYNDASADSSNNIQSCSDSLGTNQYIKGVGWNCTGDPDRS